jgi:purine-cytosine permease-like protein
MDSTFTALAAIAFWIAAPVGYLSALWHYATHHEFFMFLVSLCIPPVGAVLGLFHLLF